MHEQRFGRSALVWISFIVAVAVIFLPALWKSSQTADPQTHVHPTQMQPSSSGSAALVVHEQSKHKSNAPPVSKMRQSSISKLKQESKSQSLESVKQVMPGDIHHPADKKQMAVVKKPEPELALTLASEYRTQNRAGSRTLGWQLQVASFREVQHAVKLADRLRKAGFVPVHIVTQKPQLGRHSGMVRVVVGAFSNRSLARMSGVQVKSLTGLTPLIVRGPIE